MPISVFSRFLPLSSIFPIASPYLILFFFQFFKEYMWQTGRRQGMKADILAEKKTMK
jgi:hypothetical protein